MPSTPKQNLLAAITEPATFRTLVIAAAVVAALVAATGGSINVGSSDELIRELQLTRAQLGDLSESIHNLRLELVELDHRVDALEEIDPPPDEDK